MQSEIIVCSYEIVNKFMTNKLINIKMSTTIAVNYIGRYVMRVKRIIKMTYSEVVINAEIANW